jgi:hypothetical protein
MKKLSLVLLLMIICISSAFTFDFAFGFKGGLDLSFAAGDDWDASLEAGGRENGVVPGFTTGGFFTFGILKFLAIQAEVLFSTTGFREKDTGSDDNTKIRIYELSFPALAKFRFDIKKITLNAFGGAEFALLLKTDQHDEVDDVITITEVDEDYTNNFQLRIIMGLGVDIQMGKGFLTTDARYCLPITRIYNEDEVPDNDIKMHNLQFTVGYGFKIK